MIGNAIHGRAGSALGEHLIVALIVATFILVTLATYPSLKAHTGDTAARAQARANMPLVALAELEDVAVSPHAGTTPPSTP